MKTLKPGGNPGFTFLGIARDDWTMRGWFAILILCIGGILTVAFRQPGYTDERINLNLIPPPPGLERFTFGYREVIADSLWLRVVQDLFVCENAKDGEAHFAGRTSVEPMCRRGWVFQMLDAITNLAPKWRLPYMSGATMLSVVVDDREGATRIFEKGLAQFPYDYNLNYRAAYHYIWEEKQPAKAAPLLIRAAQAGGPAWMYALAGKLYSEEGQVDLAIEVMEQGLKELGSTDGNKDKSTLRIEKRLKELRARKARLKSAEK